MSDYADSDLVPWDIAIENGGFYFERAKYLGLPLPPACFVFNDEHKTEEQVELVAAYHQLFDDAEIKLAQSFDDFSFQLHDEA